MAITDARLSIVTFPQRWNGSSIHYRVLVLPKGDPFSPLVPGALAFADASLHLRARLIPGDDSMPVTADALPPGGALILQSPANVKEIFELLADQFPIDPTIVGNPRPAVTFKKYLPRSYQNAFAFEGPGSPFVFTNDAYECALKDPGLLNRPPKAPMPALSWGQALAFALRQPVLARSLGLLFEGDVAADASTFEAGGWIYVDLAPSSAFADTATSSPDSIALFAARLPPLGTMARPLFASVTFPVDFAGSFDDELLEAENYDDGFAKIVHGCQPEHGSILETEKKPSPVVKDVGLRLGWDDEQIAIWLNRQIDATKNTPMGVVGYRVDVREDGVGPWRSLTRATGPVVLGEQTLGTFDDELVVEVAPTQLAGQKAGDYWLPAYFATWAGSSIVLRTETAMRLARRDSAFEARRFVVPNEDEIPPLRYGHTYDFRVRLVDLSRGGPGVDEAPINEGPAGEARIPFRRFNPPKSVRVERHPDQEEGEPLQLVRVRCPLLGFPDAVFAGVADSQLLSDLPVAQVAEREVGVPDPDVDHVEVTVEVLHPDMAHMRSGGDRWVPVYTTTRPFNADLTVPLDLTVSYVDHPTLAALATANPLDAVPGSGAIEVPTSRDVRLRLTAVCRDDPSLEYFGAESARRSVVAGYVSLRQPSQDERNLFLTQAPSHHLHALMLLPDPLPEANHSATRLAERLALNVSGLTFTGASDRRTVFGCSGALRHTLAPDRSAITFAAASDLVRRWIIAIRMTLARDWTWDGLEPLGIEIRRDGAKVATLDVPKVVPQLAREADRSATDFVFFHAIDPKPQPCKFPDEIHTAFSVHATFRDMPGLESSPPQWALRLPVATPPAQIPKLVSAGIALSPYEVLPDYASTSTRERMLWLEFEEPPADPRDQYVARVLARAPDPILMDDSVAIPIPAEPPLPIEDELVRVIVPDQPRDDSGANAMRPLVPPPGDPGSKTLLVPLPDGLSSDSPDLLGFFVYELRLGHDERRWSLAQARFGAPLRVTGVQHPAPSLSCHVSRTTDGIFVNAPYATPIHEGRNMRPVTPRTEMWAVLYVQVMQVDGSTRRNVLLMRARAEPPPRRHEIQRFGEDPLLFGEMRFPHQVVHARLMELGLPKTAPLSVIGVELIPQEEASLRYPDPLGGDLGQVRILRASRLVQVPEIC